MRNKLIVLSLIAFMLIVPCAEASQSNPTSTEMVTQNLLRDFVSKGNYSQSIITEAEIDQLGKALYNPKSELAANTWKRTERIVGYTKPKNQREICYGLTLLVPLLGSQPEDKGPYAFTIIENIGLSSKPQWKDTVAFAKSHRDLLKSFYKTIGSNNDGLNDDETEQFVDQCESVK